MNRKDREEFKNEVAEGGAQVPNVCQTLRQDQLLSLSVPGHRVLREHCGFSQISI